MPKGAVCRTDPGLNCSVMKFAVTACSLLLATVAPARATAARSTFWEMALNAIRFFVTGGWPDGAEIIQ